MRARNVEVRAAPPAPRAAAQMFARAVAFMLMPCCQPLLFDILRAKHAFFAVI